jgi:uroporphyrinogen decarboxylase
VTRRERMLKALRHQVPDQVPCCPDISIMVPSKMKKRPFWELYLDEQTGEPLDIYNNENLFRNYVDACNHFGIVAWCWYMSPKSHQERVEYRHEVVERTGERVVTRTTMRTPEGELWSETVFPIADPPFPVRKFIKDFEKEFKFLKYFYPPLEGIDFSPVLRERDYVGDSGVTAVSVMPPSLVHLDSYVDGGLGALGLIYYDYPKLMAEYKEMHEAWSRKFLEKLIAADCCDEILTGGSGLMTWQSPQILRDLSLDGLKQITKLCRDHGLISHLHACGFERELVRASAEQTDLDVIEPLEPPPQGDCDLGELKRMYGDRLVFKGNLQTSAVMLADVKTVEREAIRCLEDAAAGGGFILSTGDQCGRDTPHQNIFKLVEVCEKYGKY